jgi:CheY-like chemotaxis protein
MAGFEVDVAENGKEAVDKFITGSYSLIFMDIQMPVMDGYEATRTIRRMEEEGGGLNNGRRTPIVAMTANALTRDRENCLEAGMDDFITKPVTRVALLSMVSAWIPEFDDAAVPPPAVVSGEKKDGGKEPDLPLNYDRALSEFMGDKAVLEDTLRYFLTHCRGQMDRISDAISGNDNDTVKAEAHKIKGGAANLTMEVLSRAAAELEAASKSGDLASAGVQVSKINHELDRLALFLNKG